MSKYEHNKNAMVFIEKMFEACNIKRSVNIGYFLYLCAHEILCVHRAPLAQYWANYWNEMLIEDFLPLADIFCDTSGLTLDNPAGSIIPTDQCQSYET